MSVKLLFVVGSLREGSFNKALAKMAAEKMEGKAEVSFLDYSDVPFMNQDIEFPAPASVTRVRDEVMAADAVWIFTPEYNHSIPAQLKNMVDWMSRPLVARDYATPMPLTGKPVAICGIGGKNATADSRKQLEQLLVQVNAKPVEGDGEGFSIPAQTWKTEVLEPSEEEIARMLALGEKLLAAVEAED